MTDQRPEPAAEPTAPPKFTGEIEARVTDHAIRLAFLALFVWWSLTLVLPFLHIAIWSVILSVALYPVYSWLRRVLGGRGTLAAILTTGAVLLVVSGPIALLATSLSGSIVNLAHEMNTGTLRLPEPPEALDTLPLVGHRAFEAWALAASNLDLAVEKLAPYLQAFAGTLLVTAAKLGKDLLLLLVAVVIAGFLFAPGPWLATEARRFANRLVVPRGAHFVDLAGATIRNVSRGVIGLSFVEAVIAGTVLLAAGVPGAGLIAFAVLVLCIVQIGPMIVLLPVAAWAWWSLPVPAALATSVLLLPLLAIDNVLKPILIARGLTTPTLVILVGVIGGTLSYGLIGLFLGPVVLAVLAELTAAWAQSEPR